MEQVHCELPFRSTPFKNAFWTTMPKEQLDLWCFWSSQATPAMLGHRYIFFSAEDIILWIVQMSLWQLNPTYTCLLKNLTKVDG